MKDVLSPNKRRVSTDLLAGGGGAQTARDSPEPAATSKRARTDAQPPKVLPQRYELCAVEDIVELIAHMLAELIATNDAIMSSGSLTRFHSRYVLFLGHLNIANNAQDSAWYISARLSAPPGAARHADAAASPRHGVLH